MNQIEVTAMVLVAGAIGEYDRRVVLLTKERGRISAFAKGARKPTSSLVSITNPFVFGKFTLYQGRNSYTLVSAEVQNYFSELRSDVEAAYYGFYFLEIASYYTREGNDETQMLKLLYQTFRALTKKTIPFPLIRCIFELKAMTVQGEGPQVFHCIKCGKKDFHNIETETIFSANVGGLVCTSCHKLDGSFSDFKRVSTSAIYAIQYITSSSIEKLYTFHVKEEVLEELKKITKRYMQRYIEKEFHSLEILETLTQ